MNLQQRLKKLENTIPQDSLVVVWVKPGETDEEACRRENTNDTQKIILVKWQN